MDRAALELLGSARSTMLLRGISLPKRTSRMTCCPYTWPTSPAALNP